MSENVKGGGLGTDADKEAGDLRQQSASDVSENVLEPTADGFVLKNRWKAVKRIGEGAFGQIYSGIDLQTRENIAIKLERSDSRRQVLKQEVSILSKLQGCPHVCRFLHCGRTKEYNFLIMELLGENLNELRKRRPEQRFSLGTSLQLVIQMLRTVAGIHALGYLHRDIKASNFCMGDPTNPATARRCFIVDFGLARRFRTITGEVRPARDTVGFRGTARYASINSHLSRELGPRDDLWSLLYVLVEFVVGRLPWTRMKDKQAIGELKMKYNSFDFVRDLPAQVWQFMLHIKSLGYSDAANYDHLIHLLESVFSTMHIDRNLPYDWEFAEQRSRSPILGGLDGTLSSSPVAGSSIPSHRSFSLSSQKSFLSQLAGQGGFAIDGLRHSSSTYVPRDGGQNGALASGSPGASGEMYWRPHRLAPSASNPALSIGQRGEADVFEGRAEGEDSSPLRKPRPFSASYSQSSLASLGMLRYGPMGSSSVGYRSYPAALALHDRLPLVEEGVGVPDGDRKVVDRNELGADARFASAKSASVLSPPSVDGPTTMMSGDAPPFEAQPRSPLPSDAAGQPEVNAVAAVMAEEVMCGDSGAGDDEADGEAVVADENAVASEKGSSAQPQVQQRLRAGAGETGSAAQKSAGSGSKGKDDRQRAKDTATSASPVAAGESEIGQSQGERHDGEDTDAEPVGVMRLGTYLAMASDDEAARPSGKRRPMMASGPRPTRRRRAGRKRRSNRRQRGGTNRVPPAGTASEDEAAGLSTHTHKSRSHRMSRLSRCTIL